MSVFFKHLIRPLNLTKVVHPKLCAKMWKVSNFNIIHFLMSYVVFRIDIDSDHDDTHQTPTPKFIILMQQYIVLLHWEKSWDNFVYFPKFSHDFSQCINLASKAMYPLHEKIPLMWNYVRVFPLCTKYT